MKKHWPHIILLALLVSGCARLDPFMFNNDSSIEEYQLDDYDGERAWELDYWYDLPEHLVHQFQIEVEPDVNIWAIYIGDTNRIATDTVIFYLHGNKHHMDFYWPRAKLLANTGHQNRFGVLMIDYRGYGLSDGEPTEGSLTADAAIASKWLQDKGLTSDRLVVYGYSLGTAPSTNLAAENADVGMVPNWLILESPFASTEVMVQDAGGLALPISYFANTEYDNAEQIKKVDQPFLWLHGEEDDFLSITTHGEVVFKNYSGTYSEAVRVPGGGHEGVPTWLLFENYSEKIRAFITR